MKRRLAATFSFDGDSYTAAKSQFIDDVVERAGPGLTEALF